jgi:hypothetical protein
MKKVIVFFLTIAGFSCNPVIIPNQTLDKKNNTKIYTGKTWCLDTRLLIVADIEKIDYVNYLPDSTALFFEKKMGVKYYYPAYAKLEIKNYQIYLHKRAARILFERHALLRRMLPPDIVERKTKTIYYPIHKKGDFGKYNLERCLIGVYFNYYLKGEIDPCGWGDMFLPSNKYKIDSLILYTDVFQNWQKTFINQK